MTSFTAPVNVGSGTVTLNRLIPRTLGGFHPHRTDYYIPNMSDGQSIAQALVLLPGGSETKEQMARNCGILLAQPPAVGNVFWALLRAYRMIVIVVQGQACTGPGQAYALNADGSVLGAYAPGANPFNPADVDSRSANYPQGIFVWDDHDKRSGADDVTALNDLSIDITTQFGSIGRSLCGHSEGGFMTNRMWTEQPLRYTHYCTSSACASSYYVANPAMPGLLRPRISIIGGRDSTLNTYGGPQGPGDHFQDALWYQDAAHHTAIDVADPTTRIGEWVRFGQVVAAMGGAPVGFGAAVVTDLTAQGGIGIQKKWTGAGGNAQLVYVEQSEHQVPDLQNKMHALVVRLWADFIIAT